MPTKIYTILDTTGGGGVPSGFLRYLQNPPSATQVDDAMSLFVQLDNIGSGDILANITAISTNPLGFPNPMAVLLEWLNGSYANIIELDYKIDQVGSIPAGSEIKKLTYRGGWSVNISIVATSTQGAMTTCIMSANPTRTVRIGTTTPIEFETDFSATNVGQNLTLIDEEINADADFVAFDHTGTEAFVTTGQLVADWDTIINIFDLDSPDQLSINASDNVLPGGNVQASFIWLQSLHDDWTVTVEYELVGLEWTLISPPANRAIQPGDTLEYLFDSGASTITGVVINGTPATFTVVGETLTITVPDFPTTGPDHTATPTVTTFSGTEPLQTVPTINFENAPGIYTLIDGRTHDTYYNRVSSIEGTEINTKIPNPTGRTSYY